MLSDTIKAPTPLFSARSTTRKVRFLMEEVYTRALPREASHAEEDRGYETPCWIWQRHVSRSGYGLTRRDDDWRKQTTAHRMYWERGNGPIPEDMEIHHKCRVRTCVNPSHLAMVTHAENMSDVWRNPPCKVSDVQANAIRLLGFKGRWTQARIARRFGISDRQVRRIVNGEQRLGRG